MLLFVKKKKHLQLERNNSTSNRLSLSKSLKLRDKESLRKERKLWRKQRKPV